MGGGRGSTAVWNFSENSSVFEGTGFPKCPIAFILKHCCSAFWVRVTLVQQTAWMSFDLKEHKIHNVSLVMGHLTKANAHLNFNVHCISAPNHPGKHFYPPTIKPI